LKRKSNPEIYIHQDDKKFVENINMYINLMFDRSIFINNPIFRDFCDVLEYFLTKNKNENQIRAKNLNQAILWYLIIGIYMK